MRPADHLTPEQLVKQRVAFKDDEQHVDCWHSKVGLKTGVVLRRVLSSAQKAELLASEGIAAPELLAAGEEVPRLWVKADPCPSFPRGCELAVGKECLLVMGP
jgi:hypothetical protein